MTGGRSRPRVLIDGDRRPHGRIDINHVESISVLQDAASAAIDHHKTRHGVARAALPRSLIE
jgi:hypothetical protein